jgi:hypothetical protein
VVERSIAYRVLGRKPQGRRPLGGLGVGGSSGSGMLDWTDLVQVKDSWWELVNAVMNHWVSFYAGKFLTS